VEIDVRHPKIRRCALYAAKLLLRALLVHPLAAGLAGLRQMLLGS
jgi:hypothetical protein